MEFKRNFIERYNRLTDWEVFKEYSLKPLRKSIRVNTLKVTVKEMKKRFGLEQIPWYKCGFFIKGFALGNTIEHQLGYIYLQEAASMIPPVVLDPRPKDKVLDMCASPGSKTTQMAAMMKNKGIIVANDNKIDRMKPLVMNLQRCGVINTLVTRMEGWWFNQTFDKILLDAPCSGIGAIRKSYKTIAMWNPNMVKKLSGLQKKLILKAFDALNEKGILVYSTCTTEPEENEGVVDFLLRKKGNATLQKIALPIKSSEPVNTFGKEKYSQEVKRCLRLWPQDNDTEGFFIAKIKKL